MEGVPIFVRNKNKFDALLSGTGKSYPQLLAKVKFADVNITQQSGEVKSKAGKAMATPASRSADPLILEL